MSTIVHTIRLVADTKKALDAIREYQGEIVSVSRTVESYTSRLSGDKIFLSANNWTAAVAKLGGATNGLATSEQILAGTSKLTANEKDRLNGIISQAIEKYQALGKTAPQAMLDLAEATKKVETETAKAVEPSGFFAQIKAGIPTVSSLTGEITKLAAGYATGLVSVQAFEEAGRVAFEFLKDSVVSAAESERMQQRLVVALQQAGQATPAVIEQYRALADQYQNTTIYSDELIKETETLLTEVGKVMPGQMELALRATTDLAAGLGIDLRSATILVARAFEDNFTSLQRAGVQIDATRAKAEGMGYVLKEIENRFGGQARAEAASYEGQIKILGNQFDELKESIGRVILSTGGLQIAMAIARAEIEKTREELAEVVGLAKLLGSLPGGVGAPFRALFGDLQDGGKKAIDFGRDVNLGVTTAAAAIKTAKPVLDEFDKAVADLVKEITGQKVAEEIKEIGAAITQAGGPAKLMPFYLDEMGKRLDMLRAKGGQLNGVTAQTYTLWIQQTATVGKVIYGFEGLQKKTEDVTGSIVREISEIEANNKALEQMEKRFDSLIKPIDTFLKTLPKITLKPLAQSLGDELAKDIPQAILRSVEGGGDIGKSIGGSIFGDLFKAGSGLVKSATSGLSNLLGSTIGGAIGSIVPGLGTLLGSTLGSFISKGLGNLFGPSEVQKAGREATQQLLQMEDQLVGPGGTYQTFDQLESKARELGLTFQDVWGRRGVDGLALLKERTDEFNQALVRQKKLFDDIKGKIGDLSSGLSGYGGVVLPSQRGDINDLLGMAGLPDDIRSQLQGLVGDPTFDQIKAKMDDWGISLDQAGSKIKQLADNDSAKKIIGDFQFLTENGVDTNAVLDAMSGKVQDLVNDSLTAGIQIPENMKDIIQSLIDQGKLVDDNGDKLTALGRLNWGPAVKSPFDEIKDILGQIRDLLRDALPNAASAAGRAADDLKGKFDGAAEAAGRIRIPGIGAPALPPPSVAPGSAVSGNTGSQAAPDNGGMDEYGGSIGSDANDASNGNPYNYATGGLVPAMQYLSRGKFIVFPYRPQGTDTVPAMLTPGERVLSVSDTYAYDQARRQPSQTAVYLTLQIDRPSFMDRDQVDYLTEQWTRKAADKLLQAGLRR